MIEILVKIQNIPIIEYKFIFFKYFHLFTINHIVITIQIQFCR